MIEKQIINKLLTNKQSIYLASQYSPGIFEDDKLRYLFKVILELNNDNIDVDYSLLMSYLKKIKKFDAFGDTYFLDLMSSDPIYNLPMTLMNMNEINIKNKIKDNSKDLYNSIINGTCDFENFIDKINELRNNISGINSNAIMFNELEDDITDIYKSKNYLKFDLKILNEILLGMFNGNLITISGQPGSGKTNFALQQAFNHDSLFVSLEMQAYELYSRVLARQCEIPAISIETQKLYSHEKAKLQEKHLQNKKKNFHILTGPNDFFKLYNNIKYRVKAYNLKLVVLDYLQLCTIDKMDTNSKLEVMTQMLKSLAKELDVVIIVISQLTKDSYKNNSVPNLSDLRGSGSIAQNSDVVYILWFDEEKRLKFTIAKGRKYKLGTIDNLKFNGKFSRFEETFIL